MKYWIKLTMKKKYKLVHGAHADMKNYQTWLCIASSVSVGQSVKRHPWEMQIIRLED